MRPRETASIASYLLVLLLMGCSRPSHRGADRDRDAATETVGSAAAQAGAPAREDCPRGWARWPERAAQCWLCAPSTRAALPPPIRWEACPTSAEPPSGACRTMRIDWPWSGSPLGLAMAVDASDPSRPLIQIAREIDRGVLSGRLLLVAEADGAVQSALLDRGGERAGCELHLPPAGAGLSWAWRLGALRTGRGGSPPRPPFDELIWGGPAAELLPQPLLRLAASGGVAAACSDTHWGYTAVDSVFIARHGHSPEQVISPEQAGDDQQVALSFWHDRAFWRSGHGGEAVVMTWRGNEAAPSRANASNDGAPSDPTTGNLPAARRLLPVESGSSAYGFGTDGTDMVWLERAITQPARGGRRLVVLTAPLSTDAGELHPRTMGAWPADHPPASGWKVGCGWAAHNPARGLVLVMRLSDGARFELRSPCKPGSWCLSRVLGVSCDELYLRSDAEHPNIARVPFAALAG